MKTEIKNLKKTANRILKAIKSKEKIIIYGDADLDGVTSVIILKESIKNLGGEITAIYFPDREKEGYGINEKALKYLSKKVPALPLTTFPGKAVRGLLLVLDCGIGNFKEVKIAKKLGFEVIIIEHHEILDKVPEASIVVDPKQKGDKYPFKQFATVGIIFRLAKLLLKEGMTENLRKNFLELTAMATIADMMPRIDENEEMIREGLSFLKTSWRPGIQALFELEPFKSLTLLQQVYKVNSLLNIRNIENRLPAAFRLLTASSKKEAEKLASKLLENNVQKRKRIKEITAEVEEKVLGREAEAIIFEGSPDWELILLGVVAAIISQKYQRPVFLYKKDKTESQGSIRAPAGFNTVEAMKNCSKNLITYGGHPQASGFKIKNEDLEEFKECLIEYLD
ncbi:DHH family phosphoesterase [Patescibacteria group bacterium]|nr:DHH family phosphoesterase [Patescibacteria group bacterium]